MNISEEKQEQLVHRYGDVVRMLHEGEGFGERALLENKRRALTVASYSTHLFLLILQKKDFAVIRKQFI